MKIIELIIDEEAELFGIDAISIVSEPAINSSFRSSQSKTRYNLQR